MRTVTTNNVAIALCAALILCISTPLVLAGPPDNAALYYYQAFLLYEKPDATMDKMLSDFRSGKIELNEIIKQHIERNRRVIDFVVTAADIPNCDWGYDYSQGWDLPMPNLAQLRRITHLIVTEAKLLTERSDYKTALSRCLSIHKMALHAVDKSLVNYLVALAINRRANECIQDILADMPEDLETLNWLKDQLVGIGSDFPSFKTAIEGEGEVVVIDMRMEKIGEILGFLPGQKCSDPNIDRVKERLNAADEKFFERNRNYYKDIMARVQTVLDIPYPQTYAKLRELNEKVDQEYKENPDAILTAICLPALGRVYSIGVNRKTLSNAIQAGVEIYIIKAKTGRLPEKLPIGLPRDLFSGKDFEYERKDDGFVLRCHGKNLADKDKKIYEYEFKVKK